jgi:tetratricopeptide (TPR) repeat protein
VRRCLLSITTSVLVIALGLPALCAHLIQAQSATPRRIVLVGIDGADWLAIDPLIRAGRLPTFARLRSRGRTGVMLSTPPLISPMIWTSIATGVEPENHGVLDFTADLPDGRQVPVGSSQRLAPALWNLFSYAGRRVAVVGWWATWPAEHVQGTIVSDALAPQLTRQASRADTGVISPSSSEQRILSQVVRVDSLTMEELLAYAPVTREQHTAIAPAGRGERSGLFRDPITHLAAVVAGTRTYSTIAQDLLRSERPDFLAVYFEAVDTLSHLFVRTARDGGRVRAIDKAYEDADSLLRRLAENSPADTLVIVCSDHGFYPATAGITESPSDLTGPATAWHRPYGMVGVATASMLVSDRVDPSLPGPGSLGTVTPIDIAPTILHAAGVPVPTDMPGRIVAEMLPAEVRTRKPNRAASPPFKRVAQPDAVRTDSEAAVARLQALGYVSASRTSLARQNLAESLLRRGKFAAAERELQAVLASQPRNLFANLWLAQALLRQARPGAALAAYEKAIGLPGGAREALVAAVDLALASNDFHVARRLISSAEPAPDARAAVYVARGTVAEKQRDLKSAETNYRAALKTDPTLFDALARLFELLAASGRSTEALAVVERSTRAARDSPRHVALLGEARLGAGDAPGAERTLRHALELAPDGDSVRIVLGRALLAQKKPDEAIAAAEGARASADRDVVLGAAYSSKRDYQRAIKHLQAALDAGRVTPDVLNALGYAHLQLGRKREAATMFERSLSEKGNQPEIRRLLAEIKTPIDEPRSMP